MFICSKFTELKKLHFLFLFVIALTFSFCAKKGRPSGGPKDEQAPIFVTADPPYEHINFDKREIYLYFDEYITLKDLNKQLIISPPLNPENPSLITPQGSPSKFISIKLLDTLQENTTYTFDFGNSVQDNNEGNKIARFKYVFSTGNYIDSLTLKGSVKSSYSSDKIKDIKLLLYRLDSAYTDSTVYKKKPNYVTSTLDTSNYKFTNIKEGAYFLIALKDAASDYIFNPRMDEIGFYRDTIQLPRDSVLIKPISLFKEILPYSFKRVREARKGQLIFSYEGKADGMKVEVLSDVPDDFKTIAHFEKDKDTLNVWHSPIERDSLVFKVIRGNTIDTATVNLRKKTLDSLSISPVTRGLLEFKDTLFFNTNNPIVNIDTTKISLVDKDTIKVPYTPFISQKENKFGFLFDKKLSQNYTLDIYPDAVTDIFNYVNKDTIQNKFRTKSLEDYGEIIVSVINPQSKNVIIQITDTNDKTVTEEAANTNKTITFKYLPPKTYKIRVIYDENNNGKWDTGNFLLKKEAEVIEYFPEEQAVRPNWTLNAIITIK